MTYGSEGTAFRCPGPGKRALWTPSTTTWKAWGYEHAYHRRPDRYAGRLLRPGLLAQLHAGIFTGQGLWSPAEPSICGRALSPFWAFFMTVTHFMPQWCFPGLMLTIFAMICAFIGISCGLDRRGAFYVGMRAFMLGEFASHSLGGRSSTTP